MADFIEQFKKEIAGFTPTKRAPGTGVVLRVGDGVAEIEGLDTVGMSEMVRFDMTSVHSLSKSIEQKEDLFGLVLNLEEESVRVIILGDAGRVQEGMAVVPTGEVLSINVGEELLGRVVNPLGVEVDGLGEIKTKQKNPIEREAYGVMDRQSVKTPLHTGTKAIDSIVPIGRGQRELIIGDRYTGKTTVAIDTIFNQLNEPKESAQFVFTFRSAKKKVRPHA
jgi:F-type H+-transporting ATPase subunit alpha